MQSRTLRRAPGNRRERARQHQIHVVLFPYFAPRIDQTASRSCAAPAFRRTENRASRRRLRPAEKLGAAARGTATTRSGFKRKRSMAARRTASLGVITMLASPSAQQQRRAAANSRSTPDCQSRSSTAKDRARSSRWGGAAGTALRNPCRETDPLHGGTFPAPTPTATTCVPPECEACPRNANCSETRWAVETSGRKGASTGRPGTLRPKPEPVPGCSGRRRRSVTVRGVASRAMVTG